MYLSVLALSALVAVNALSVDAGLHARHAHLGQALAKRDSNKRCKARNPADPTVPSPSVPAPSPSSTTTPAAAPPATTAVSSSPGGNAKACLAVAVWDNSVGTILANFKTSHVSVAYNWGAAKIPGADALGYTDVPMLHDASNLDQWSQLVVPGYAKFALGFNEPDASSSYIDPGYACQLWQQHMLPLRAGGYQLVSPGLTSNPLSVNWMKSFFDSCGGADSVDKIAVHWYGTDHTEFVKYLQLWHDTFGKPLWVTEFACMDFVSNTPCPDVNAFAGAVRNFMDNTPWVEIYCPFDIAYSLGNVNGVNQLLGGDLRPTTLGNIYFS